MKKEQLLIVILISLLLVLGIILYALTLKGVRGNIPSQSIKDNLDQVSKPLELSPERGRFILTKSLAENKSFALTNELADAAHPDVGYYEGKYFIYFPPGISMLALPLYIIGSNYDLAQIGAFATISIFAVFNLLLIFIIGLRIFRLPIFLAIFTALLFGFATTSWSYAITLYQHQVTTFFILYSLYAGWKYKQSKNFKWLWGISIWSVYGYSLFVDYPNAFLLLPVVVYFFLTSIVISKMKDRFLIQFKKEFIFASFFFLILILMHGYYNYTQFGDWSRVSGSLVGIKTVREEELLKTKKHENQVSAAASRKRVVGFFNEKDLPGGFATLLFSSDRGLFIYIPIFIIALFGIYSLRSKINLETGVLLGTVGVILFLYSSWGDPWGGWAYGPRYLIPSMAILSIFVGVWLNNSRNKLLSSLVTFVLFAYSCFIALLGALTTNQVPPKIEADFLKMKYNFLLNWDYFVDGKSGSFIFNEYASKNMNLQEYFLIIYIPLILIVFTLLFIVPMFEKKKSL